MAPIVGSPIDGGYVSIVDGRIAAVGANDPGLGPVRDLGDVVLLPGLVNAHTHLEFSDLASPLGASGMALPEWIRLVIAERKRGRRDTPAAIAAGLSESLAGGTTTLGEIATAPAGDYESPGPCASLVLFQEVIGFSAARAESVGRDVRRRVEAAGGRAGISPHAPYTVHPALVESLVALAADLRAPVAMHLAESREELELLADRRGAFRELLEERSMWDDAALPGGWRPLNYLEMLANAPRSVVVHGNYLAADEIDFVGQRRATMAVVYCPRTHAFFRHAPYPLEAMLASGVRVALGTDSRASNPDLSLLAELRFAAARHPAASPATLVRMATLDGAAALGLEEETGSLTVGKRADLLALPCSAAEADPYAAIVSGADQPAGVWVGGRQATVSGPHRTF